MKFSRTTHTLLLLTSVVGIVSLATPSEATNGYWSHGYGSKSKAMAGAGTALPLDGLDASSNPAKITFLDDRIDLGLAILSPERGYSINESSSYPSLAPGAGESDNDYFFIPHFAITKKIDADTSLAFSMGGNCGMNTDYSSAIFTFNTPTPPPAAYAATSPTSMNFGQGFVGATYSKKIGKRHAFGITPILAVQFINVKGLEPFKAFSVSPDKVSNNGVDYAYGGGVRLGWFSQITDSLSLGASYQSRLWMTEFDKYEGLFAEEGSFDIPPNLTIGLAYKLTPTLTLALDYQRIFYEDIKSVSNSANIPLEPGILGCDDGLGFGWSDMDVAKIGLQWDYRSDLTFRAGFSINNAVIHGNDYLFNILAPAVIRKHYTFGMTKKINQNQEFNFAFMYAPEESVSGTNLNTGDQTGSIYMEQMEVEMSWSWLY